MKIDNWFTGIIEECDAFHNRARVRMFSVHSFNPDDIATTDLPWATLLLPITSASSTASNLGELRGRCVFGFFRDGDDMQDAVVIGVYEGLWNQNGNGAYNPAFNATGSYNSMTPSTNSVGVLNVGTGVIGGIAGGGFIPSTAENPDSGTQNLPNAYADNSEVGNRIAAAGLSQLNRNVSYATNPSAIAEYFSATNNGRGAASNGRTPWCAAFVTWSIKQAGIFDEKTRPKTAFAYGFYRDWARIYNKKTNSYEIRDDLNGRVIATQGVPTGGLRRGDIVAYSWSHVGIVTKPGNGTSTFESIEGNTGSPGRVALRPNRRYNQIKYVVRIVK